MSAQTCARINSEAVQKRTGKSWDGWFAILDAACAKTMTHHGDRRHREPARKERVVAADGDRRLRTSARVKRPMT